MPDDKLLKILQKNGLYQSASSQSQTDEEDFDLDEFLSKYKNKPEEKEPQAKEEEVIDFRDLPDVDLQNLDLSKKDTKIVPTQQQEFDKTQQKLINEGQEYKDELKYEGDDVQNAVERGAYYGGKSAIGSMGIGLEEGALKVNDYLSKISDSPGYQEWIKQQDERIEGNIKEINQWKNSNLPEMQGTFGEKVGGALPFASMVVATALTKSPYMAQATAGSFGLMGFGEGIEAYDKEKENKDVLNEYYGKEPEEVDEAKRLGTGALYSAVYSLPMAKYLKSILPKNAYNKVIAKAFTKMANNPEISKAGTEIWEHFLKTSPAQAKTFAKQMGGKTLHSIGTMEGIGLGKLAVDKYFLDRDVSLDEFKQVATEGLESGLIFGVLTAPFGIYAQNTATKQRRQQQGSVVLGINPDGKAVEIIPGKEGNIGITPEGKQVKVSENTVRNSVKVPYDVFEKSINEFKKENKLYEGAETEAVQGNISELANKAAYKNGEDIYVYIDKDGKKYFIKDGEIKNKDEKLSVITEDGQSLKANIPRDKINIVSKDDFVLEGMKLWESRFKPKTTEEQVVENIQAKEQAKQQQKATEEAKINKNIEDMMSEVTHSNGKEVITFKNIRGRKYYLKEGDLKNNEIGTTRKAIDAETGKVVPVDFVPQEEVRYTVDEFKKFLEKEKGDYFSKQEAKELMDKIDPEKPFKFQGKDMMVVETTPMGIVAHDVNSQDVNEIILIPHSEFDKIEISPIQEEAYQVKKETEKEVEKYQKDLRVTVENEEVTLPFLPSEDGNYQLAKDVESKENALDLVDQLNKRYPNRVFEVYDLTDPNDEFAEARYTITSKPNIKENEQEKQEIQEQEQQQELGEEQRPTEEAAEENQVQEQVIPGLEKDINEYAGKLSKEFSRDKRQDIVAKLAEKERQLSKIKSEENKKKGIDLTGNTMTSSPSILDSEQNIDAKKTLSDRGFKTDIKWSQGEINHALKENSETDFAEGYLDMMVNNKSVIPIRSLPFAESYEQRQSIINNYKAYKEGKEELNEDTQKALEYLKQGFLNRGFEGKNDDARDYIDDYLEGQVDLDSEMMKDVINEYYKIDNDFKRRIERYQGLTLKEIIRNLSLEESIKFYDHARTKIQERDSKRKDGNDYPGIEGEKRGQKSEVREEVQKRGRSVEDFLSESKKVVEKSKESVSEYRQSLDKLENTLSGIEEKPKNKVKSKKDSELEQSSVTEDIPDRVQNKELTPASLNKIDDTEAPSRGSDTKLSESINVSSKSESNSQLANAKNEDKNKNLIIQQSNRVDLIKDVKYIETKETRIDNDFDKDDPEYNQYKALKPFFINEWYYADNTDPVTETFTNIEDALKDLRIPGNDLDLDGNYEPYKIIRLGVEEVWLDSDGNEVYDGDKISYDEWAYDNRDNEFVKKFGVESFIKDYSFDSLEKNAQELESKVYSNIHIDLINEYESNGNKLNIKTPSSGKYRRIIVENEKGEDVGEIKLRISDHAYNPANNNFENDIVSIEIANENKTAKKFNGLYGLRFNGENTYNEVVELVNDRIKEIIDNWNIDKNQEIQQAEQEVEQNPSEEQKGNVSTGENVSKNQPEFAGEVISKPKEKKENEKDDTGRDQQEEKNGREPSEALVDDLKINSSKNKSDKINTLDDIDKKMILDRVLKSIKEKNYREFYGTKPIFEIIAIQEIEEYLYAEIDLSTEEVNEIFISKENTDKYISKIIKEFLESDLSKVKIIPEKNRINSLPEANIGTLNPVSIEYKKQPIKKNIQASVLGSLKNVITTDELRPVMNGVLIDPENNVMVASDAHKLVVIPVKAGGKKRIIAPKNINNSYKYKKGQEIEGNYPDYKAVIPEKTTTLNDKFKTKDLLERLEGINRVRKFITVPQEVVTILNFNDTEIHLQPNILYDAIEALYLNGSKEVEVSSTGYADRAVVFRDVKNKDKLALVMPIIPGGLKVHVNLNKGNTVIKPAKDKDVVSEKIQPNNLKDVGEKIGGAKKDIWKQAINITKDDIVSQPLSKSFPEPDYLKMIEEGGVSIDNAILMKFLYDNIPSKPRKKYRVQSWVNKVQNVIDTYNDLLDKGIDRAGKLESSIPDKFGGVADEFRIYKDIMKEFGFPKEIIKLGTYGIRKFHGRDDYTITNGRFIVKDFPTIKEAAKHLKNILSNNKEKRKKISFGVYQNRNSGEIYIGKKSATGVVPIVKGFTKLEDASNHLKENQEQLESIWEGMKIKVKERRDINRQRVGTDWRKGKDVTASEYSDTFGFRGVEFGNWVNLKERQEHVNAAYDSLMDLATALNIPAKAISLGGELGFAFGARGSGDASVHYEPGKVVINLTKTKGAGSLAHEWWHSLDNYFSRKRGEKLNYLTQKPRQGVVISENRKVVPDERIRKEMHDAFKGVVDAINKSGLPTRSKRMDETRSKLYWSTPIEMSARAFENFIIEKLGASNQSNDYLANFKETGEWIKSGVDMDSYPYPLKEESEKINSAFQEFFDVIQTKTDEQGNEVMFRIKEASQVEDITETDNFKKWSKNAPILQGFDIQGTKPGEPQVFDVYHGTTNEFYIFDPKVKGEIESHFGLVNYFTSDEYDANQNYLSTGPDLTNRIEREKEQLEYTIEEELEDLGFDELKENYNLPDNFTEDSSPEEIAKYISEKKLKGGSEKIMELFVRLDNPVVINGINKTWIEPYNESKIEDYLEDATREIAEEYDISEEEAKEDYSPEIRERAIEIGGIENQIIEAAQKAAWDNGVDPNDVLQALPEQVYFESVSADDINNSIRKSESAAYLEDDDGKLVNHQIIGDIFKNLGYDGIVLVNARDFFYNMKMDPNTSHVHLFDGFQNQVKLSDGTNVEFGESNDIRFRQNLSRPTRPNIADAGKYVEYRDKLDEFDKAVRDMAQAAQKEFGVPVNVVSQVKELPEKIQRIIKDSGHDIKKITGLYDPIREEVHIVSTNNKSTDEIKQTIAHEIIAHKGLRQLFGNEYVNIAEQIYESIPQKDIDRLADVYQTDDKFTIADEFIAETAEKDVKPSWWKDFIQKIRDLFRKLFNIKYTTKDIEGLLKKSAKNLRKEAAKRTGPPQRKEYKYAGEYIDALVENSPRQLKKDSPNVRARLKKDESLEKKEKQLLDKLDKIPKKKEVHYNHTLIKNKIKYIKQGWRLGNIDTKRYINDLQKNIVSYAKKYMPFDQAGKAEVNKLLSLITKADTPEKVEEAFDQITDIVRGIDKRRIISNIDKLLKKNKPKTVNGKPQGRMNPDVYETLDKIRVIRGLKSDEFEEYYENIDELDVKEIALATLFGNLEEKSRAELEEAYTKLSDIVDIGKIWYKDDLEDREEHIKELRYKAIGKITGGKGIVPAQEYPGGIPIRKGALDEYVNNNQSFEWLLDKLSKDKKEETAQGWMQEYFGDLVHKSTNAETKGIQEVTEQIHNKAAEIFGKDKKKLAKLLAKNSEKVKNSGVTFINRKGERQEIELSQNDAYKKWMEWQDPTLEGTFEKMGWDGITLLELEKFLDPKVKKWAEWQLDEFYPSYYEGVNKKFRETYYVNLPFNEKYSPIRREVTQVADKDDSMLRKSNLLSSVGNASLKSRVVNKTDLQLLDGDQALIMHVTEMEHFKAWVDTIKELRAVFGSRGVQHAIKYEHGNGIRSILNRQINDFASGGKDRSDVIYTIDKVRRAFVTAELGLNYTLMPKQLVSSFTYMSEMPIHKYAAGMINLALNFREAFNTLTESETVKERYRRGWTHEVHSALKSNIPTKMSGAKSTMNDIRNFLMIPTKLGDFGGIMGGWTVYRYHYNKQKELQKTDSEAHRYALNKFERAISRSQQSSRLVDTSELQKGSFGKLFTMFKNSQQQYFRYENAAIRNLLKGRGSKAKNIKIIALYHVLLPVIFQAVANFFTDDDPEKERKRLLRAGILGSFNGMLILSDIVEFLLEKAMGERWSYSATPIEGAVNNLGYGAYNIYSGIKDMDREKVQKGLKQLGYGLNNMRIGLPYRPTKKIIEQIKDLKEPERVEAEKVMEDFNKLKKKNKDWEKTAKRLKEKGDEEGMYGMMSNSKYRKQEYAISNINKIIRDLDKKKEYKKLTEREYYNEKARRIKRELEKAK